MKKIIKYRLPFFVIMILSMTSCSDFFDTTIEIDPPTHDKKISLIAKAFAGDSIITMNIRGSLGILEEEIFPLVPNIKIDLRLNGERVSTIPIAINDYSAPAADITYLYIAQFGRNLIEQDVLEITVSGDGYPSISATDTVPESPIVSEGKFKPDGGKDESGDDISKITFFLRFSINQTVYFVPRLFLKQIQCSQVVFDSGVQICQKYDTIFSNSYISMDDPFAVEGNTGPLVKHNADEGKKLYTARLSKWSFGPEIIKEDELDFEVISISESFYRYDQSLHNYFSNGDNPFSTPSNIKSNIKNGYGVFALANSTKFQLQIE